MWPLMAINEYTTVSFRNYYYLLIFQYMSMTANNDLL